MIKNLFIAILISLACSSHSHAQSSGISVSAGDCKEISFQDPTTHELWKLKIEFFLNNDGLTAPKASTALLVLTNRSNRSVDPQRDLLIGTLTYGANGVQFDSNGSIIKLSVNFDSGLKQNLLLEINDRSEKVDHWIKIYEGKANCSLKVDQVEAIGSHN